MAKKKRGDAHGGGHGWFVTFADLMGLMMSFFVMLVAFSTMDNNKLKIVAGSMRDAFGVQTQVRYSGIIESDGLPTRPKLKNAELIPRINRTTSVSTAPASRSIASLRWPRRRCGRPCRTCRS
jgi:chemotaxis protein MotB